jgi:hypothetical protein
LCNICRITARWTVIFINAHPGLKQSIMKRNTSLSKIAKISFVFLLSVGVIVFIAFTKQQRLYSQAKLVIAENTDDDEALSTGCGGVERWDVKVLTDPSAGNVVMTPKNSSVFHLDYITTPTPTSSMPRYDPVEDSVYTVVCTVTAMRVESDSDWHLVITDFSGNTMIAESACPSCNSVIASPYISQFTAVRNWIAKNIGTVYNTSLNIKNVEITAQAFIDPPHGQSGAAPNNLELHSILNIQFAPTSVENISENATVINVYPNPSSGFFHVQISDSHQPMVNGKIEVYNMIGEQVFEANVNSGINDLNMQGKAKGIYLYKILSETSDFVSSGKLLIQ